MSDAQTVQWTIRIGIVMGGVVAICLALLFAEGFKSKRIQKHEQMMKCMDAGKEPAECRLVIEGVVS